MCSNRIKQFLTSSVDREQVLYILEGFAERDLKKKVNQCQQYQDNISFFPGKVVLNST